MASPPVFSLARVGLSLLPSVLRRPVAWALLRSALSALEGLRSRADGAHCGEPRGTYYRLAHTGQACSLEALLNDRHDAALRRISVGDGEERWWLFTENELTLQAALRTWLGAGAGAARWLHPDADHRDAAAAGGFVVRASRALAAQEAAIRASVDDMRVAGTAYEIVYF